MKENNLHNLHITIESFGFSEAFRTTLSDNMQESGLSGHYKFIAKAPDDIVCIETVDTGPAPFPGIQSGSASLVTLFDLCALTVTRAYYVNSGDRDSPSCAVVPMGTNLYHDSSPLTKKMDTIDQCVRDAIRCEQETAKRADLKSSTGHRGRRHGL